MSSLVPQNMAHSLDLGEAFDSSNPRSLVNITSSVFSKKLKAIPSSLTELDLSELKEKCLSMKGSKNDENELEMIRTAFWIEYNRAQRTGTNITMSNIFGGLMGQKAFDMRYADNSFRLLYIITPPVDYQVQQHRILDISLEQEKKILSMPIMKKVYNKEGDIIGEEIDTKLLAVQQKISEAIKNRVMGMPVNRTMQVNQNINQNVSQSGPSTGMPSVEMNEDELKDFISRMRGDAPGAVKDVKGKVIK